MATSLADALSSTGLIPPASAAQLGPEGASDTSRPKPPKGEMMEQYAEDQSKIESARKERDSAAGDIPKFPTLTPAPVPNAANDPIKGYVSAIGILGAVGSMFTRTPMTNSMNAAAAALNAMNSSDQAAFKQKFEEWKVQNDNAFKLLDYQTSVYKNILDSKNKSVDERISELQAHAAMFKDDYMMQLAQDRHIDSIDSHVQRMQDAAIKAQEYSEKIKEAQEKRELYQQWEKENPNAKAEEKASARSRIFDPSVAAAEVRKEATATKNTEKNKQNYQDAVGQIDELIDMAQKGGGMGVTGIAGLGERALETVETAVPAGATLATPASDFQSKLNALKLRTPKLLTGGSKSASDERAKVDTIVRGVSAGDTRDKTINSLRELRDIFSGHIEDKAESKKYAVGDVVINPKGEKRIITGFDSDGTPLGEPINDPLAKSEKEK